MGGASLLASLKKYRVFETWKKEKVSYVNIIDTNNFNSKICDPFTFAFLSSTRPSRHIIMDVINTRGKKTMLENPVILQEEDGSYNGFFPFEVSYMNYKNKTNYAVYETPYLNIFTTTSYLYKMTTRGHLTTFSFRIREENDGFDYETNVAEKKFKIPGIYRFVQSIFNLLKGSDRVSLIERDPKEMVLWKNPVKLRSKRDKKGDNKVTAEIAMIKCANEYHRRILSRLSPTKSKNILFILKKRKKLMRRKNFLILLRIFTILNYILKFFMELI